MLFLKKLDTSGDETFSWPDRTLQKYVVTINNVVIQISQLF